MNGPEVAPGAAFGDGVAAAGADVDADKTSPAGDRDDLAWHRAETERLRVLVEFLARPVHAHGGSEPDPDIVTAYNLAVEAALQGIRRAAAGRH